MGQNKWPLVDQFKWPLTNPRPQRRRAAQHPPLHHGRCPGWATTKKAKLNIDWKKDHGKGIESAPWFPVFQGERINDHHLTLAEKQAARGAP